MKRILIIAGMIPLYLSLRGAEPDYEKFVKALTWIESRHNPFAVGVNQDHGLFQITPIRLKDYNQRTGSKYSLADCFDVNISRKIFDYYSAGLPFEVAARRWNGGPAGCRMKSTIHYWDRIIERMY